MCRLFGMSGGTREVQATFWLLDAPLSLLLQSENQPDGVGLGTFSADGSPRVYRKPVAANRSETFIAGASDVRSATFLSHIRHATVADRASRTRIRSSSTGGSWRTTASSATSRSCAAGSATTSSSSTARRTPSTTSP